MNHEQIEQHLKDMSLEALERIMQGDYLANVQDWQGDVFISLTMFGMKTGVWHIGIPTSGAVLFATDHFSVAVNEVNRLLNPVEVQVAA